jgi:hypothetical protein
MTNQSMIVVSDFVAKSSAIHSFGILFRFRVY